MNKTLKSKFYIVTKSAIVYQHNIYYKNPWFYTTYIMPVKIEIKSARIAI